MTPIVSAVKSVHDCDSAVVDDGDEDGPRASASTGRVWEVIEAIL
jgi:hypothetical protein